MTSISIDGPSGAGKSTISKLLAQRLGFEYLDTGAMYRALTYKALKEGVDINDETSVCKMMQSIDMYYKDNVLYLDGDDVEPHIRTTRVTASVSKISEYACVRDVMVMLQRELSNSVDMIVDGRDIGTVVLPNADFKFYLTADAEERAKRRYLQIKDTCSTSFEQVLKDIVKRDNYDSNRKISPLCIPKDAIIIDSTNLTIDDVVIRMVSIVRGEADAL